MKNVSDRARWSRKSSFSANKKPFQKLAATFMVTWWNISFEPESRVEQDSVYFFVGWKMKELWLFFWRGAVKNLKKMENYNDFEFMDFLTKVSFICILWSLAPSEAEFYDTNDTNATIGISYLSACDHEIIPLRG